MPHNKPMSSVIRQRPDFHTSPSSDVLDEFIAMNILNKTADNDLAHAQWSNKPNLALKAKAIPGGEEEEEEEGFLEDTKYAYHEHMALASRQFWGNERNSRPNFSKNNSSGSKGKQCVRTCYNCGSMSHFMVDCSYEKRKDNGGNSSAKTRPTPSPPRTTSRRRCNKRGWWCTKSTSLMMILMMMQVVK
jgi:hypothetical protein